MWLNLVRTEVKENEVAEDLLMDELKQTCQEVNAIDSGGHQVLYDDWLKKDDLSQADQ